MNVLTLLREVLKDTTDTIITRANKINLIKRAVSFYNSNIYYRRTAILTFVDWIHYTLPTDTYRVISVFEPYSQVYLSKDDYEVDEVDKTLTITQKYLSWIMWIWGWTQFRYSDLILEYSRETFVYEDSIVSNIIPWVNTITVATIWKYYVNAEIILLNGVTEEKVTVTAIDTLLSTITFSSLNTFTWTTSILCDIKVKQDEKDIITYYAAYLSQDTTLSNTAIWLKNTWSQWKISNTTEVTNTYKSIYLEKVEWLLKDNPKSVQYVNNNTIHSVRVSLM